VINETGWVSTPVAMLMSEDALKTGAVMNEQLRQGLRMSTPDAVFWTATPGIGFMNVHAIDSGHEYPRLIMF